VTRSGLFVRLRDTGADGFVPASSLLGDVYRHVEEAHALVGARSGQAYRLGDSVQVASCRRSRLRGRCGSRC
jgi:ribonuclease R